MNARNASRLVALSIVAGALPFAACGEKKKPGGPGPAVNLGILLSTPSAVLVPDYCPEAGAVLLTIEEVEGRSRTFLYTMGGDLRGCAEGACGDEDIQTAFTMPARIVVELINLEATSYAPGTAFDVICRGVADTRIPGQITTNGLSVQANAKVLRVGALNPLFADLGQHPTTHALAGAPVTAVPPFGTIPRRASGGGIVFAGGFGWETTIASNAIHVFDPVALTMRTASETMLNARGALTATAIADSSGSSILFAGGASSTTAGAYASAELYVPGSPPTDHGLFNPRSGHAAVYFPQYDHANNGFTLVGNQPRNAVLLVGGCEIGVCASLTATPPATATMEAFYLQSPPVGAGENPTCKSAENLSGSCTFASSDASCTIDRCADPPRSLAATGPLGGSSGLRVYTGQGYQGSGFATGSGWVLTGYKFSDFDIAGGMHEVFAPSVAVVGTNLGMFGGYDTDGGLSLATQAAKLVTAGGSAALPNMQLARAAATATSLLDGRVLVAGGNTGSFGLPSFTDTLEILRDVTLGFEFVSRPGLACDPVTAPSECDTMADVRSGHAAVRIDGSLSWLNGAVVLAGGKQNALDDVAPELFVPAYDCDSVGLLPETLSGKVDFCDRGRVAPLPADPRDP